MLVLVFLLVPETARLTLEQIDDHFLSGRAAWRTSTSRNRKIAKGEVVDQTVEHDYIEQKS
jgi:SP family sugar:H+ symporter-like MFS transporter